MLNLSLRRDIQCDRLSLLMDTGVEIETAHNDGQSRVVMLLRRSAMGLVVNSAGATSGLKSLYVVVPHALSRRALSVYSCLLYC